jgi:hypothetical protein
MTAEERLALIREKIERAKKHLADLDVEIHSFLDPKPYEFRAERDPQTRQLVYYLASIKDMPSEIPLIAGDAFQNLRSALDHLACRLVEAGAGIPIRDNPEFFKGVSFPIRDTEETSKDESARLGKVKRMRQNAVKMIDDIKPYKGGDDTLWRLHKLNNIDKHRLLFTVVISVRSTNAPVRIIDRTVRNIFPSDLVDKMKGIDLSDVFYRVVDKRCGLQAGDELFRDAPDTEFDEKMDFMLDIALSEPGILECESLLETLVQTTNYIDSLIATFKPELA